MNTPVCDFVGTYAAGNPVRLHMPGHKGRTVLGPESADITEIEGADELYRARGIIRESEENAAALFGASRTLYSAEGSSLCIRAMLYLASLTANKKNRRLLAGRNAHRTLMTAAALLDYGFETYSLTAPLKKGEAADPLKTEEGRKTEGKKVVRRGERERNKGRSEKRACGR